jgi:hypothetical protein
MKTWYKESREAIEALYDKPDLFCDLLAATSPRNQVKANWRLADKIYMAVQNNEPIPLQGALPCHKGNIDRAIKGLKLSGKKVCSFAENLKGNLEEVTIDIWVLRYYEYQETSLSGKKYELLADRIRQEAKEQGLKPAEYRAKIWTIARKQSGKNHVSFSSASEYRQGKLF